MDDLDHSMHIAEFDWTSFYEECEECGLLQPSLACPDNLSLSDSEDSGKSSSVINTDRQELQLSPAADSDEAAGCCEEELQINQSDSGWEQEEFTVKAKEDSERRDMRLNNQEENRINTEATNVNITTTLQTEQLYFHSSDGGSTDLKKEDADVQTESDASSIHEPDPLSCNQTEENVNEPHAAADTGLRAEKERWFVTVNDSPARQRMRGTSMKKKQRPKKAPKKNNMCRTPSEEKPRESGIELEASKDDDDFEDGGSYTQSNQSPIEYPAGNQVGLISDSSQMSLTSGEEDDSSDNMVTDRNKYGPNSSQSFDAFLPQDPSQLDGAESDELEDSVEFLSTHSYDSESYLSAAESVEHLLIEQLQSSSSLTNTYLFNLTENSDANTLTCSATASNCEGYQSTNGEPSLISPSAVDKMPDDKSTCDNDTSSKPHRKHEINLPASGCSSGDELSLPAVPDVILTPCPVADSPETYAEAAGHTRPVFAISRFWDEMEKLTINDILQLRMGRSTPPRDMQETATPATDDFPANPSSLVEYNSFDGGLLDTSDTTDSDYFTQLDESRPDRSSCEFSTSDFEEEYWQFLGASRNPSPDPQSKNQQRSSDSPFIAHEEEESTCSEGKETPVPSEDFAGESLDNRGSFISSEIVRLIPKTKSVRNVQALNTEDLSLLGNDESSLCLSGPLEENVLLKAGDSRGILTPAPFLSSVEALDYQISYPEVFEYLLTEDKAKRDSCCATVFDQEDISVASVFDFTLCKFSDETISFLRDSQRSEEKPIPIFSCSHPTVRELTFPNPDYVFLSSDRGEEGDISPIRVVSHCLIQGSDSGTSAHGFHGWKSLLSIRKIRFHDKGSIWCRESGAWVFPVEAEKSGKDRADPPTSVVTDRSLSLTPSQLCRELAVQQGIFETLQTTRREGVFSTLKQSDMCLVCIAFASWVLRSSDPEAADAWKAALLANVSALSAIQYLRQYVKKRNRSQDDP